MIVSFAEFTLVAVVKKNLPGSSNTKLGDVYPVPPCVTDTVATEP